MNTGMGKHRGNVRTLGQNAKNVGNRGSDAMNQGGNVCIAVEMTLNSNGNDKFKEWSDVKMIETSAFVKTKFHTFDLVPFLSTLGIFRAMSFCFYY